MPYAPKTHRPRHYTARPKRIDRRASAERERKQDAYGPEWNRLSGVYFRANPLCEDCGAAPYNGTRRRHEVDHIIPINGPDDPLLLEVRNLRTRCRSCHAAKTARHDKAIREEYDRTMDVAAVITKWRDCMFRQ